jgi:hypothetical protein
MSDELQHATSRGLQYYFRIYYLLKFKHSNGILLRKVRVNSPIHITRLFNDLVYYILLF